MLRRFTTRSLAVTLAALLGAGFLTFSLAAPAQAHVKVDPGNASAGGYATLTFRVPNESPDFGTVKVEVDLPTKTPFGSVSYLPVAGWDVNVIEGDYPNPVQVHGTTVTEGPVRIVWTAQAGVAIEPGQFQEFVISAGPVPDVDHLVMPAYQTYADGTVVGWDELPKPSGDATNPAPVLYVNGSPDGAGKQGPSVAAEPEESSLVGLGVGLGLTALIFSGIGIVVAVLAFARGKASNAR